jgi:ABC-type transport system involved in multi-copper enzyme maturation permease subunit
MWGDYIIGTFSSKEKANQAIDYYSKYDVFKSNPAPHSNEFEIKEVLYDVFSDNMLDEIKADGWFDNDREEVSSSGKFGNFILLAIIIFILACLILGFASFLKLLFRY